MDMERREKRERIATKRSQGEKGEKPPSEVEKRVTLRLTISFIYGQMMRFFSFIPCEARAQNRSYYAYILGSLFSTRRLFLQKRMTHVLYLFILLVMDLSAFIGPFII